MFRLVFQTRDAREPFVGGNGSTIIGRDATCALRLSEAGVSDQHAAIERRADGYYVRDLGSATGVRVNGQPATEQRLAGGDELEVGAVRLHFEFVHEPAVGRRSFEPLQILAIGVVAVLIAGQVALFGWILSQDHPRKARTDITKGSRQQQQQTKTVVPEPPELLPLPPTDPVTESAPASDILNRMLKIVRVERVDGTDSVTLRIQVKAQVSERALETGQVRIFVQFSPPPAIWLNAPADWENFSSRTFTAKFPGPPQRLTGYVVRTYYRNKLQDEFSS